MRAVPLIFLLLLFAVPFHGAPVWADSVEENRRLLEEIEKRMGETTQDLQAKQKAARVLEVDLKKLESEMTRLRSSIGSLEAETKRLAGELSVKSAEITRLQGSISRSEVEVRRRLAALYKTGGGGSLRLLFAETSPARAAETYDFLGRVVRRDRELLGDYRRQLETLDLARKDLALLQGRHQTGLDALQQQQSGLRRTTALKTELLARARKDEGALNARLVELRERSKRLSGLIKELESAKARKYTQESSPGGVFSRQKGRLAWPVEGPVRTGFGTSRSRELGTLRESQGVEIQAAENQAIRAVWSGRVLYANSFRGFGNLLIVDHGEGYYSLYAQAARLSRKVGDLVNGGDVLASTGGEGVYFEIRHHGTPLDPALWLLPR